MSSQSQFVVQPPPPTTVLPGMRRMLKSWRDDFTGAIRHLFAIYKEPVVPSPPVKKDVGTEMVESCLWIYEHALASRGQIEEKAKSTFGVVSTIWPIFSTGLIFLIAHHERAGVAWAAAIVLLFFSISFLAVAFVWTSRTTAIKEVQVLGVDSVMVGGDFREYDAGFRAAGLVYCSCWNIAMNARYAQFVRYAHAMIASGVFAAFLASIPLASIYSSASASEKSEMEQREQKLLSGINNQTAVLADAVHRVASSQDEGVKSLRTDVGTLQQQVSLLELKLSKAEAKNYHVRGRHSH